MVNRGASRGCITCRKRRVKCDETKPVCKECVRLGRECEGYGKPVVRVRFLDQTGRYFNRPPESTIIAKPGGTRQRGKARENGHTHQSLRRTHNHAALLRNPQPKQQDMAVAFFLTYVTDIGRSLESTRGFLEFIRPVLAAESHKSALSVAVNATAVKLWTLLMPYDTVDPLPLQLHSQALVALQQAIYSPVEQGQDGTVLAALMLQQYDTLTAVFDNHNAQDTHREGALALLTLKGSNMRNSKYRGHLLGNLFHSRVSFCVRHNVPLSESELNRLQVEVIPALPSNPSSLLDIIGMSILRLQDTFTESLISQGSTSLTAQQALPALIDDVDAQLRTWLSSAPAMWHPRRIQDDDMKHPSVVTYKDSYDIYPSVQIANIWNTWRIYRLVVEYAKMQVAHGYPVNFNRSSFTLHTQDTSVQHLREIQDLVESICRSIPFYLGNCSQPVGISDMDNPQLVFPSYHDLPSADEAHNIWKNSDYYVSKIDHCRHVILHGPLHALSVLSSLIGLLQEERCPGLTQSTLCRQIQWINQQFRRALYIMRFTPCLSEFKEGLYHPWYPNSIHQALPPTALTKVIRQALGTVNVL